MGVVIRPTTLKRSHRKRYRHALSLNGPPPQVRRFGRSVNGNTFVAASYNATFDTYLDFYPAGGIHIELAQTSWSVNFSVNYVGPVPATAAQFANPANWNWAVNQCKPISTNSTIQIIQWNINVDTAKQNGSF